MEKNHSPFAIVEIGCGIICLLIGVSSSILQESGLITGLQIIFLGAGLLCYGMSNNNADKSERGKMISVCASICLIISAILSFYNYYYLHK